MTVMKRQDGTFSLIRESVMASERGTGSLGMAKADGIRCRKRRQRFWHYSEPNVWYLTKRGDIHRIKEDLYYERYDRISTSQRLFISHSLSGIMSKINSFNMLASFFLITFLWLRNEVKKKSSKSLLWYRFTTKSFIGTSSWYVYHLQALSMHVVFKSGNQIYRSILISKKLKKGGCSPTSPISNSNSLNGEIREWLKRKWNCVNLRIMCPSPNTRGLVWY